MIEEVDPVVLMANNYNDLSPRKNMGGEEYFETNPNDNSFEYTGTGASNRDLVSGPADYTIDQSYNDSAYKMLASDSVEFELAIKPIKMEREAKEIEALKKDFEKA